VFQEIALQGLPVRICLDRAGFVGDDGAVHHGFMDISIFAPLPGVVMLAASDEPNLIAGLEFMRQYDAGASIIRYPRDNVAETPFQPKVEPYVLGKAAFIQRTGGGADPAKQASAATNGAKPDIAILAYGTEVYEAAKAMADLEKQGYDIALYDARFAKPVDIELVRALVERGIPILTVEDHSIRGGFGALVLEACNDAGISTSGVHRLAMPEKWVYQASRKLQLAETGLDAAGIARRVRQALDQQARTARPEPAIHVVNTVKATQR
jgi:1-deoxy-D-xylulose-5-phosphate synthase